MILFVYLLSLSIRSTTGDPFCLTVRPLIDNILTIGDYVLIASNDKKYWVYEQTNNQFIESEISVKVLFNGQ